MERLPASVLGALVALLLLSSGCASQDGAGASAAGSTAASPAGAGEGAGGSRAVAGAERRGWSGVPEGHVPEVPYVAGNTYLTPQGTWAVPRRRWGLSGVVEYAGGLLMSDERFFEGSNGIHLVTRGRSDPNWRGESCSSGAPTVSGDGRYVAWVTVWCPESESTAMGAVHRAGADGSNEVVHPVGADLVGVVGFVGDDVVFNTGWDRTVSVADFRGGARTVPGIVRADDTDPLSGRLVAELGNGRMAVVSLDGRAQWSTTAPLRRFSPDGSQVLAVARRRVTVLDAADGTEVASFRLPAGARPYDVVWETDVALLALMRRERQEAVVRLGLDGTFERATALRRAGPAARPHLLLGS